MTTKVLMAWSGGKDSAMALHRLRRDPAYEVTGLLTTFTRRYGRVQMHGVRHVLVEAQAEAIGLPLYPVWMEPDSGNAAYDAAMGVALAERAREGVEAVAFGDLFLEDIRAYRENKLAPIGLQGIFPLWGEHTGHLAQAFLSDGFHATLTCIDPKVLPHDFAGRTYNADLLGSLPEGVDPCGENGEFHTFVHGGPGFAHTLETILGVRTQRMGFVFADLLPVARPSKLHHG